MRRLRALVESSSRPEVGGGAHPRGVAARAGVLAVAVALSLSGCDAGGASSGPSPLQTVASPGAAEGPGDGGIAPPLPSPLASYLLQGTNLHTIQAAETELAGACLKRFGFEPVAREFDQEAALAEQRRTDARLYGITDLDVARIHGYQLAPATGGNDESAQAVSASYTYVYTGDRAGGVAIPRPGAELTSPGKVGGIEIPPGGCLGEARAKLWGSANSEVKDAVAQNLRNTAYDAAKADARVQQVLAAWSRCMAAGGFSYQDPLSPDFDRDPSAPPSTIELNTAVADIECKKQTELVKVWNQVDVEKQQQALEKHHLQLSEVKAKLQAGLRKAVAVLDGD